MRRFLPTLRGWRAAVSALNRLRQPTISAAQAAAHAHERGYDYIVAGAGSAGCLLAERLSRDPAIRVLLVEAGPKDTNPW
mgnify:CR=1 FL=1